MNATAILFSEVFFDEVFVSVDDDMWFDSLRDLVSFVQFKKREKHPWRNITFSKLQLY